MRLDYFTIQRNKRNSKRTDKATRELKIYKKPRLRGPFSSFSGYQCILCGKPLAWSNKLRLKRYELSDMHRSCKISGIDEDNKHR